MGFRFRRSVKLLPGVRLNLGKRGASMIGRRTGRTRDVRAWRYANDGRVMLIDSDTFAASSSERFGVPRSLFAVLLLSVHRMGRRYVRSQGTRSTRPRFGAFLVTLYLFALLIGVVAGSRTFTAPAAVSWAAKLGWLHLSGTPLGFLGASVTPYIFTLLALGELILDKLPNTPSRKAPSGFIGRIVSGALCGAAIGAAGAAVSGGLIAGAAGAVIGTFGFYEFRSRLVKAIGGRDLPIALLEDACAIVAAVWIVGRAAP